jgi:hypothetical protein
VDEKSCTFSNEKNPELSGDFEIKIKVGKHKFRAWFNVSFLVQIAEMEEKCRGRIGENVCKTEYRKLEEQYETKQKMQFAQLPELDNLEEYCES